ncbi:hypothetical protein BDC45DRAFT_348576 [Circinella umbellata]|nr:hypothetical protein BDC45DRAFT_348576 [Circinella umbellata]
MPTDFFGRVIQHDNSNTNTKSRYNRSSDIDKSAVTYHYHEGFSNAVRKPMNVHMFL